MKNTQKNNTLRKLLIILFWIGVWFLAAVLVNNKLLFVNPYQTGKELVSLLITLDLYRAVWGSLLRIGAGFLTGLFMGVLMGTLSYKFPLFRDFLSPIVNLFKTVPVAAFVVLFLIWWGPMNLSFAICMLVVFPGIYFNTYEGLQAVDVKLLEMAEVYRMPFFNRLFYLYMPALKPFLLGAVKVALGMSWKSGVAAEVIGVPEHSIGEGLYLSKVYLNTAGVFAWTAVIILISFLFEKLILFLINRLFAAKPRPHAPRSISFASPIAPVQITDLMVSFDDKTVIDGMSREFTPTEPYLIQTPSGSGKTTLFRVLSNLLKPTKGTVSRYPAVCYDFQENRLLEEYDAITNVAIATGDVGGAAEALSKLLPVSSDETLLTKSVKQLSGGEQRRVALVRAMEAKGEMVLLDEPYTGMDEETMQKAQSYINERLDGRILLINSHR